MNYLKRILHLMADITALLAEIATIHSEGDVTQEITTQVNTAVTAATADLQQQITDANTAIKAIADQLTSGNVSGAQATATAALAAAPSA